MQTICDKLAPWGWGHVDQYTTQSLAAVIVAASGLLESIGLPLSAAVSNATLNLASVQSETEKLRRRKMTGC